MLIKVIALICGLIFDLSLFAGTAYLVGWGDWSKWTFLFTYFICVSFTAGLYRICGVPYD